MQGALLAEPPCGAVRVAIHTWGSEGDVRPSIVLAERLAAAGHEARLTYVAADGRDYGGRLAGARFEHRETGTGRTREELHQLAVEVFSDTQPVRQLDRIMKALLEPSLDGLANAARADAVWADVCVSHPLAFPLAVAAEAANKPHASLHPVVLLATRELHPAGLPNLGPLNRLGWWLVGRMMASRLDAPLARVRGGLGLARRSFPEQLARSDLDLVAISPTLVPRPSDWPSIQGGEAWARTAASPSVLKVARSAHDAVFPRCSIVVHHGGAGTTQTALRTGRAAVVVAHMIDQDWWARRLARLGVAGPPLSRARLAPEPLARAIVDAQASTAMRARADEPGALMRTEDGAARGVELIESLTRR